MAAHRVEIQEARAEVVAWGNVIQSLEGQGLPTDRAKARLKVAASKLEAILAGDDPPAPPVG